MADEIKKTINVVVTKNKFSDRFTASLIKTNMAGSGGGNPGIVTVGSTAEEAIAFGDVTPGLIVMHNLSTANYVTFGPESGGSMVTFGHLRPSDVALFELASGVTLRAQADTADVSVLIKGYST